MCRRLRSGAARCTGDRLAALDPDRVTALSYEALMAEPAGSLRRLAAFIGVAADEGWVSAAAALAHPGPPRWLQLPADRQARLVEVCAPGRRGTGQGPSRRRVMSSPTNQWSGHRVGQVCGYGRPLASSAYSSPLSTRR